MTMPIILPRVPGEAAAAGGPNAASNPYHADGDAPSPVFGSVLTLLLAHVAQAAPDAKGTRSTSGTEVGTEIGVEQGDASADNVARESSATASPTDHAVPTLNLVGQQHGAAVGQLTANPHAIASANEHSALANPLMLEGAADAVIGEATISAEAPSNVTVAIAVPTIVIPTAPMETETNARRSLDLVVPEFRNKLDRVIERMESEFGYKVEVTETYRSQSRQNVLYEQGRTEPGQVVTWTRASNHTAGRAADLVVDGSYDNPLAYQRLMTIAREEGLRTLGPRDTGHVELPSPVTLASARGSVEKSVVSQTSIAPTALKLESPAARVSPNVGEGVARVATVATVAHVAQVAAVVVGGQNTPVVHAAPGRTRSSDISAARTSAQARRGGDAHALSASGAEAPIGQPPVTATSDLRAVTGEASSTDGEVDGEPDVSTRSRARFGAIARESATETLRQTRDELLRAVATVDPNAASPSSSGTDAPATVGHADMSERIARLLKVQDAAGDRPLSQVVLRLERPDGGEDRLRVDLRGSTVSATLDVADQAAADHLGANVKELQRALERHGFEAEGLTVRSTSRAAEASTLARAAAVETDLQRPTASSPNTSTNTSSRERGARHDEERPSPDSQRHRSRREHKGDR
jgi:hypothetical protein